MAEFVMPSLGADMEAATLMTWHIKPGDAVKRGDVIAEVETDKGLIEIECFTSGVVTRLVAEPGSKLEVGEVMAVIQSADEPEPAPAPSPQAEPVPAGSAEPKPKVHATPLAKKVAAALHVDLSRVTGTGPGGRIDREDVEHAAVSVAAAETEGVRLKVSPLARRRAAELNVDLTTLHGSGPCGAIELADVERAAAEKSRHGTKAEPATPSVGMRRAIAAAMAKSKREIPHYYLQTRIDMSRALTWLTAENQARPMKERMLPAVVLLKAVAQALRDVPSLNGFWIDNTHRISEAVHIGFAVSMKGGGLVAPAIHDVDRMSSGELMAALRDLIPRARSGRLRSSEMTGATLTVTSLGDLGVETVFGVIYPPQVAIVGFGKIIEQPWARDGMLGVHPVLNATLAADHRATDGHTGAQFLDALNRHLQNPESL